MKKILLNSAITSILAIGLTGCLGEDISCSGENTQSLVKQITEPNVINSIFLSKYQNGDYGETNMVTSSMLAGANGDIEALSSFLGGYGKDGKDLANSVYGKLLEGKKELKKTFKSSNISLDSFITTAKDKELSKVECSATLNVVYENNTYSFDTTYTAQLTDDKKEIFVQVDSFLNK